MALVLVLVGLWVPVDAWNPELLLASLFKFNFTRHVFVHLAFQIVAPVRTVKHLLLRGEHDVRAHRAQIQLEASDEVVGLDDVTIPGLDTQG